MSANPVLKGGGLCVRLCDRDGAFRRLRTAPLRRRRRRIFSTRAPKANVFHSLRQTMAATAQRPSGGGQQEVVQRMEMLLHEVDRRNAELLRKNNELKSLKSDKAAAAFAAPAAKTAPKVLRMMGQVNTTQQELEGIMARMRDRSSHMRNRQSEAQQAQRAVDESTALNDGLDDRQEEFHHQNVTLMKDLRRLDKDNHALMDTIKMMEMRFLEKEKMVQGERNRADWNSRTAKDLEADLRELSQSRTMMEEMSRQLEDKQEVGLAKEDEIEQAMGALEEIKSFYGRAKDEIDFAKGEAVAIQDGIAQSNVFLHDAISEIETTAKQNGFLLSKMKALDAEAQAVKAAEEDKTADAEKKLEQLTEQRSELGDMKEALQQTNGVVSELQGKVQELDEDLAQRTDEMRHLAEAMRQADEQARRKLEGAEKRLMQKNDLYSELAKLEREIELKWTQTEAVELAGSREALREEEKQLYAQLEQEEAQELGLDIEYVHQDSKSMHLST